MYINNWREVKTWHRGFELCGWHEWSEPIRAGDETIELFFIEAVIPSELQTGDERICVAVDPSEIEAGFGKARALVNAFINHAYVTGYDRYSEGWTSELVAESGLEGEE
jgi:hypothetical protein